MEVFSNEAQVINVLDTVYRKALNGIPAVSSSVEEFANDYLRKSSNPKEAAKSLINYQIAKCGTSGFLTGLGGAITLPVAIPANVGSVLYVQLRMIAAIAKIGGFDVKSDQVQALVYSCLVGKGATELLKNFGIDIGQKCVKNKILEKVSGETIMAINKKVGFRLLTKAGTTGTINLVKLVPVVGGVVGGAMDVAATKAIATVAYKTFID